MNKSMAGKVLVFMAVALLIIVGYMISRQQPNTETQASLPEYPIQQVRIEDESYKLLVPQTEAERTIGLAAVASLPAGYGMLFPGHGQIGIWMKDMEYPIDIIWLDEKHQVIHVVHGARPDSYPQVFVNPSITNARQVIELNSGEVERIGLEIGQGIKFVDD